MVDVEDGEIVFHIDRGRRASARRTGGHRPRQLIALPPDLAPAALRAGTRSDEVAVTPSSYRFAGGPDRSVDEVSSCGALAPRWTGQCPACGEWNSLVEQPQAAEQTCSGLPSATARTALHRT